MTKFKKIRRLSMDLTKDPGGYFKVIETPRVTITGPVGRIVAPPWILDPSIKDGL